MRSVARTWTGAAPCLSTCRLFLHYLQLPRQGCSFAYATCLCAPEAEQEPGASANHWRMLTTAGAGGTPRCHRTWCSSPPAWPSRASSCPRRPQRPARRRAQSMSAKTDNCLKSGVETPCHSCLAANSWHKAACKQAGAWRSTIRARKQQLARSFPSLTPAGAGRSRKSCQPPTPCRPIAAQRSQAAAKVELPAPATSRCRATPIRRLQQMRPQGL